MLGIITYQFSATVWKHPCSWYFVSLPSEISTEIRTNFKWQEEGWGRLKAKATIADITWDTAIWYDTKQKCYLLPIKASIRKQLRIDDQQTYQLAVAV